jgi:hypothetical protein
MSVQLRLLHQELEARRRAPRRLGTRRSALRSAHVIEALPLLCTDGALAGCFLSQSLLAQLSAT